MVKVAKKGFDQKKKSPPPWVFKKTGPQYPKVKGKNQPSGPPWTKGEEKGVKKQTPKRKHGGGFCWARNAEKLFFYPTPGAPDFGTRETRKNQMGPRGPQKRKTRIAE